MKNIILLISDTYRFDNLFDRASMPVRTPNLDRFASERAGEMLNFYTGSFPTIPHRTDVITARIGWPRYGWQDLRDSGNNAWPRMLGAQGYSTQLICDCPHLFNSGFQKTFEAAFQHRGQEGDLPLLHLNDPLREVQPHDRTRLEPLYRGRFSLADKHRWTNRYFRSESETFAMRTGETAVRWLEENSEGGPFFLWVDFFDPHEPWDPPEYLVKRYQEDYDGVHMIHPNYGRSDVYTEGELVNLRAHYAAEAEVVDRALGRVFQKIDDLQLWDDSVVVFTSDHGFTIGEHGRTGKSNLSENDSRHWPIYPEVGHVPFLIAGEGVLPGAAHGAIAQPVDILPTVCELAGADVSLPEEPDGRSFAAVINGAADRHRPIAVSSTWLPSVAAGELPERAVTPFVTDGEWGYVPVEAGGGEGLYDLGKDPLAESSMVPEAPDRLTMLREAFLDYVENLPDGEALAAGWRKILGA